MRTAAIIQARMGSTRLPNKVLMPVLGKPLLGWMLDRVSSCKKVDEIIIATTIHSRDDKIADFAHSVGCRVYRGSEDDVLDRYYQAAKMVDIDAVIRITADCPLLDPKVLEFMIDEFTTHQVDFLSNSEPLPSSWPDGMDISIIGIDALRRVWSQATKPSDREHVTFYFWNNLSSFRCRRVEHLPDLSRYRITIDYQEDFELIKIILEYFNKLKPEAVATISMEEIIGFLNLNPDVFELNEKYKRGLGWQASFERDKQLGY